MTTTHTDRLGGLMGAARPSAFPHFSSSDLGDDEESDENKTKGAA